jgi:hypothetical protein
MYGRGGGNFRSAERQDADESSQSVYEGKSGLQGEEGMVGRMEFRGAKCMIGVWQLRGHSGQWVRRTGR